MMRLQALVHEWPPALGTPLRASEVAFALCLQMREPSTDDRHRWLAALAAHQWGRGHACLDLLGLQDNPADWLGWLPGQVQRLPADVAAGVADCPWIVGADSPLVWVHGEGFSRLYLRRAWQAEQSIRASLLARLQAPPEPPQAVEDSLKTLFAPLAHSAQQREACRLAAHTRVSLITGGPGTGKTTTVVRLLALLLMGQGPGASALRIHLAAPTGKAAARLGESIAQARQDLPEAVRAHIPADVQTLHRLLQSVPEDHTLATDVVVVDEASMIDLEMMARLLAAVPLHARLVLLGDRDQLASVEAGAVLTQLGQSPWLAPYTVRLTHSHRFRPDGGIGAWARAVQESPEALPALWDSLESLEWQAQGQDRVQRWPLSGEGHAGALRPLLQQGWADWWQGLQAPLGGEACDDAKALSLLAAFARFGVLCALREGPWGVAQLNHRIAKALGLGRPGQEWYVGSPVMVTRNDYTLGRMNGDIGLTLPTADGQLRVAFANGKGGVHWVSPARLGLVETVFALTVHKSQGSEFGHVLLVLPQDVEAPVLTRELVYTGMTRARQTLSLWLPQPAVLWQACARTVRRSGGLDT